MNVLLMHAFPLDARMWEAQAAALEGEGHDVVAPDLPGSVEEPSLAAWGEHVLALVDGPFAAVGCSMGGYLAFELWRQAPGRITGLVLADTRAGADTPEQRAARDENARRLREEGFDAFWAGLEAKLFAPDTPSAVVARARAQAAEQPVERIVRALEALRDRPDSVPTLATVSVPTLVLVGSQDALTPPADSELIAAAVPGAKLVQLEGAGHLTPLERPAELSRALLDSVALL